MSQTELPTGFRPYPDLGPTASRGGVCSNPCNPIALERRVGNAATPTSELGECIRQDWLADEYDAAQARGEVQKPGGDRISIVPNENNAPNVADLGLTRKDIYEVRQIRAAEVPR